MVPLPVMMAHARWSALLGLGLLLAACVPALSTGGAPTAAEIPHLEAAVARDSTDVDLLVRLGAALRADGRLEEAQAVLESALRRAPEHPGGILFLGLVHEDRGQYADARALYQRYSDRGAVSQLRAELRKRLTLLQRRELEAAVRTALAREAELADTPPQPRTLAVFPFLYAGADPELRPLGRALAEMLSTDLSQTDRLRVLERAQVQLILNELSLQQGGAVDPQTVVRSGRILGAERVVQGSIRAGDQSVALEAEVVRVADSERAPSVRESDALDRLFDMEKRLALGVYESLGIQLTPAERELVNRRPTESLQALLAYGLGLEALDAGDFAAAARYFRQAVTLDPSFAEAAEALQEAEEMEVAARTPTEQIAAAAVTEIAPEIAPPVASDLVPVEVVLPAAQQRDPAAEILGSEGIGGRRTLLELIIRRP